MERIALLTGLALLPSIAFAQAPVVWWNVSDNQMEDVIGHESALEKYEATVTDHEVAVERRIAARDLAKVYLADARDMRRDVRQARRDAKKDLRKARRGKGDLLLATTTMADMDRDLLEADDLVDLQKERIRAREEHLDLERARYKRAIARMELEKARMVAVAEGDDTPNRFHNQMERIADRTREERSEWDLARVTVREREQDHFDPADYVAWQVVPLPVDETAEPVVVDMGDEDGMGDPMDLRRVHFDLESSQLDTEALNNLAWNAHVLRNNRDVAIRIEGHTDATGTHQFNRELAWDRAEAIESYLQDQGVWSSQLETVAYGELVPAVATSEATELNRRAEFVVIDDGDGLVDGTLDNDLVTDDWN
jgi:outer membrane protein OmpA-like peptidoglycan-associated protein